MSFIISEAVDIQSLFRLYSNGAFLVVQKANFKNNQFDKHWKDLLNKTTENKTRYFRKMIEEVSQCSYTDANNSCDMENARRLVASKTAMFDNTEAIVTGVYAIINVFERILKKEPCLSSDCPWIFEKALKEFNKPITFSFLKHSLGLKEWILQVRSTKLEDLYVPGTGFCTNFSTGKKKKLSVTFHSL